MRTICLALVAATLAAAALSAASLAPATAADLQSKPILKAPILKAPPRQAGGGFWISGEYLAWDVKGDKLPALVTTSPPGTPQAQAGVLGAAGTSVLFGGDSVNEGWRSGARVRAGYWFDPQHVTGLEGHFFILGRKATDFAASSSGSPILARPFFNASSGSQDASLLAFPGVASGSISISETSQLIGAGGVYRTQFCSSCLFGSVSGLVGYRFLRLRDNLAINDSALLLSGVLAGATISTSDQFQTTNYFHGLDLGLTGEIANGPWSVTWLAKVALGGTFTDGSISGSNTVAFGGSTVGAGGLLAQPTNIGSHSGNRFAVAPELNVNLAYQLTGNLRAFAGYSVLYWTGLVRPGGTIDTTVNPTQLGGGPLVGAARPQAQFATTDYWAQGLNLGLAYSF